MIEMREKLDESRVRRDRHKWIEGRKRNLLCGRGVCRSGHRLCSLFVVGGGWNRVSRVFVRRFGSRFPELGLVVLGVGVRRALFCWLFLWIFITFGWGIEKVGTERRHQNNKDFLVRQRLHRCKNDNEVWTSQLNVQTRIDNARNETDST